MKIELTVDEYQEMMESLVESDNGDLFVKLFEQVNDSMFYGAPDETPTIDYIQYNVDTSDIVDGIYAIVDALDDLEEAYDRVSSKTGLV